MDQCGASFQRGGGGVTHGRHIYHAGNVCVCPISRCFMVLRRGIPVKANFTLDAHDEGRKESKVEGVRVKKER